MFATFGISKNRHNMLDGFITNVENKVNKTAVYGQIRKTLQLIIIQDASINFVHAKTTNKQDFVAP